MKIVQLRMERATNAHNGTGVIMQSKSMAFIHCASAAHQFATLLCVWTLARRANSLPRCSPHYLLFIIIITIMIWSEGVSTKPTSDKIFRFLLHTAPLRFAYNIARRTQHTNTQTCWCGARKRNETNTISFAALMVRHLSPFWIWSAQ